jgi:hypothetical protein
MKWVLLLALFGSPAIAGPMTLFSVELSKSQICTLVAEEIEAAMQRGDVSRREAEQLVHNCLIRYSE